MARCTIKTDPRFSPSLRVISRITNANTASITTTFDHGYSSGIIVRFKIPTSVGMPQLDNKTSKITVTGNTTFTVNINTLNFDIFNIPDVPLWFEDTCALVIPIGSSPANINNAFMDTT